MNPSTITPHSDAGSRSGSDEGQARELLEQLQKLVEEQFQHVESLLDQYDALLGDQNVVSAGWLELQEQRRSWESQCEKLSGEINEEYTRLSEGWDRLEQYQRQIESTVSTATAGVPTYTAAPVVPAPASIPIVSHVAVNQPATASQTPAKPEAKPSLDICDSWTPQLNDAAALQFQQMKRQIRNHCLDGRRR